MFIGIDIGGTTVKIGLIYNDKVIHKIEKNVAFDNYDTPIMESVLIGLEEFIQIFSIPKSKIRIIGVSATGQINTDTGTVIGTGGNIKNWEGTEIKRILEEKYKTTVSVLNDADCMIIAEYHHGKARGCQNAIGITVGTGIGGGIIVEDRILNGRVGIAGEIGHMSISKEDYCTCGNIGCFEQYASMTALIKKVTAAYENNCVICDQTINGKYIFDNLEDDEILKICVEQWISDISVGIVNLVHIFNPEIIVIGGAVSVQKELFMDPLRDMVLRKVMPVFKENLRIESATFGNDAGMIGGVAFLEGR